MEIEPIGWLADLTGATSFKLLALSIVYFLDGIQDLFRTDLTFDCMSAYMWE